MYVTPFGRAFDRATSARSDRTMRGAVGVAVAATGLGLAGVVLLQSSLGYGGPFGLLFGGLFPFALAAALVACGVAVLTSDLDSRSLGRIGLWWLVGSVAATGAAVGVVIFESSNGGRFTQPAVVVAGNTATGGLTGLAVGVLAARRLALLSERDRERQRLADERERLTLLNRIVRHDLGNDLQVIDAAGDWIERSGEADPETVDRLRRTTREAIDVTEQVRTFLQAMDGDDEACHAVDLRRILETQVDIARSRHPEATVRVDGDLPPVSVLADELLSSVVHNLISNAVAHHDGRHPTVALSVRVDGDTVRLRVADDGPGIPEAVRETLFEQGELGPGSSGTGIGLYIVATLVERYSGTVHVADGIDGGAAFVVSLRSAESPPSAAAADPVPDL